jgi:hypothetical protein
MAFTHEEKEKVLEEYFRDHMGTSSARSMSLNWQSLGYAPRDLSELEMPFTQEEIKDTIDSMPSDKAPGPDGFTGVFFKSC